MELQASRFAGPPRARTGSRCCSRTRTAPAGTARRSSAAAPRSLRADALGRGRGPFALQAAIAEQHAIAPSVAATDWPRIVLLYEALGRSPRTRSSS